MTEANERTILVLNGPNLNLLGKREPGIYGHETLADIEAALVERGRQAGFTVACHQSNFEGELLDLIHDFGWKCSGIIINPGAFTHYSIALRDAIAAIPAPVIEIHLSNTAAREAFRHHSVIAPVAIGTIAGLGSNGYHLAMQHLIGIAESEG